MRVLLLMTAETYRASDFLAGAKEAGVEVVIGTDARRGAITLSPGRYLRVPFDDPGGAAEIARDFARRTPVGAVVAVDDDAVVAGAAIADALGCAHHPIESAAATRHKGEMRRRLAAAGVSGPVFHEAASVEALTAIAGGLPMPCVVKPVSLSASRGVIRADTPEDAVAAGRRILAMLEADPAARRRGPQALLVEGYLPGEEVAVEGLLTGGALEVLAIFDKPDPLEGPYFEETLYLTPSRKPEAVQQAIERAVAEAASALGLVHGPVHAEVRVDGERATIVEIAARTIGGLCGRTLRFGTGMSLEAVVLRHALGLPVRAAREAGAAGALMLPIPRGGVLRSVGGVEDARAIPGVESVEITMHRGDAVVPLPEGRRYLGFVLARAETPAAVERALREAGRRIVPDVAPA